MQTLFFELIAPNSCRRYFLKGDGRSDYEAEGVLMLYNKDPDTLKGQYDNEASDSEPSRVGKQLGRAIYTQNTPSRGDEDTDRAGILSSRAVKLEAPHRGGSTVGQRTYRNWYDNYRMGKYL